MKGRILILTGESPDAPGGMEHVIRELTRGLEGYGYNVEILHRYNSSPKWIAKPANKWQGYAADLLLGWYLGRRVKTRLGVPLIAVVSNALFGWYLPKLPKAVKKIHIYHGTYRGASTPMRPFISAAGAMKLKWWDSMILERLSGHGKQIICNSDQTRKEVLNYFGHRGVTAWLPMNTNHFRPLDQLESRRRLSLPLTAKIGMFVGSTQPPKGFPVVRTLMESLPDVKWVLALRGEVPDDIRSNQKISLFENATSEILPSLYSAADFTVCPSVYESFGYVVAEALACGTPVVTSVGGASYRFLSKEPFRSFLIQNPSAVEDYLAGIREILRDSQFYRKSVIKLIRPEIESVMSTKIWLMHFCELTGL